MSQAIKLLFVEDEEHLRNVISLNLELEGYEVFPARTGEEAISLFKGNKFDFVLLDVMLPEIDGYAVCEHIRMRDQNVPIMFLSARSSTEERKKGLKLGADDYLAKPFDLEELLLRIKRLINRATYQPHANVPEEIKIGQAKVNFKKFNIVNLKSGEEREMNQKESLLLQLLISRNGEALSRNEILDLVWASEQAPSARTIDNFIVQFRKDFEENPKEPKIIKSIHGVGYRMVLK